MEDGGVFERTLGGGTKGGVGTSPPRTRNTLDSLSIPVAQRHSGTPESSQSRWTVYRPLPTLPCRDGVGGDVEEGKPRGRIDLWS